MRSRHFWPLVALCVSIGGAMSTVARAAPPAQLPESTTSREIVSATGCVQPATPAEKAGGGDGLGGGFMLRGVKVGPSLGLAERPALPATSPGTPASTEGSQATNTAEPGSGAPPSEARASGADIAGTQRDSGLRLVGDRGVDLAAHVGHRVLVTGRLSSFAAPGGVASTSSGRTLTVTKVSLISTGCTVGS
jgi:hypothetical protein